MKKMLALALGVFMIVGATLFVGCGSKSVFDGNYEEVQVSEVQDFVTELQEAEKSTRMDYLVGSAVKYSMEMEEDGATMEMSIDVKVVTGSENNSQFSGSVKEKSYYPNTEERGDEFSGNIYYKDGYMYFNGTVDGKTKKYKNEIDIEDTLYQMNSINQDIVTIISFIEAGEGYKCFMDSSDNGTKIKVTYERTETSESGSAEEKSEVIFVFDKDKNMTAMKISGYERIKDANGKITGNVEIEMTIESWSGTISLPSDLDTYLEK